MREGDISCGFSRPGRLRNIRTATARLARGGRRARGVATYRARGQPRPRNGRPKRRITMFIPRRTANLIRHRRAARQENTLQIIAPRRDRLSFNGECGLLAASTNAPLKRPFPNPASFFQNQNAIRRAGLGIKAEKNTISLNNITPPGWHGTNSAAKPAATHTARNAIFFYS